MENAKYMDEEALHLFLLWGQSDEDRAEIAAALRGEPAKVSEPTRCERAADMSGRVVSLDAFRARRVLEAA